MTSDTVRVGRITVELSHTGKVLFPDDNITKGDLVAYYQGAAEAMLPWLRDRPVAMQRYPDGITTAGIMQKNVPPTFRNPDQLIFDLDPPDADRFGDVRFAALVLRELLQDELSLAAFLKTTGGKGLHVHVPLDAGADFDAAREFAQDVAALITVRNPGLVTTEQRKDKRGKLVYLDVMRNSYAQLAVTPYSIRARPGAPVATPLSWEELEDKLRPGQFTIRTVPGRLSDLGGRDDPWAGMRRRAAGLARAQERLRRLVT